MEDLEPTPVLKKWKEMPKEAKIMAVVIWILMALLGILIGRLIW